MSVWSRLVPAVLLVSAAAGLPSPGQAQGVPAAKRVLVLYWYGRDNPGNVELDEGFQAAMRAAAPRRIEVYSEYLETNRFPGENQSLALRDYLQKKYADRRIDVVVANSHVSVSFLLRYRDTLFAAAPIVFSTMTPPSSDQLVAGAGATGIVYLESHRRTLDLALKLHPVTKQVFVISGTASRDKQLEKVARRELQGYEGSLDITYLTDLRLAQLVARVTNLPENSIILYVWQQLATGNDTVESPAILAAVAHSARVPIYGLTVSNVGRGAVGGYVVTTEDRVSKMAELTLRLVDGTRATDFPVEGAPVVPMFDWRELQRWGIREDLLPPGSIVRFREPTMWQQYKWRIVAAIVLFILQGSLIAALLVERQRARRSQRELQEYKSQLEELVEKRTAELVQARDQALAANRSKSMFLAHMSHELRTPLNAILGFSGMVLRDDGLPPKHRQDLTIVANSGEHLLGLIDEVLDMAKIETGGDVAEIVRFDLYRLLGKTVEMMRGRAQARNLALLLEISPRSPQFVQSDSRKLRQILINLVGNAVKYTDQGRVVLRSDARRSEDSANLMLTFDVEDTGIGIAPNDEARIFEPFVQVGNAGGRQGTGLGLSISRHVVELLGGQIELQSLPGHGSRFHFEIPAQTAEADEIAVVAQDGHVTGLQAGQQRYRVLIAEDQTENWLLLQRQLEAVGFEVRVAEDGLQAIEAFNAWRPHFIWMDVHLPVLDGMEAAKRIRTLEGGRDVRIVAVTASAFASQREEVIAAGFDDFLRKPYRSREIFDCMARHLPVQFRYASPVREDNAERPATLNPDELAALPPALQEQLKTAVISLDRGRVASAINEISKQNARLGDDLMRLADRFSYTPILHALQICRIMEPKPDHQERRSVQDHA